MSKRNSRERIQQRRSQRQRRSQIVLIAVVAVAALAVVGVLIFMTLPRSSTPTAVRSYQGLPQDIDTTGATGLAIGAKDAPVVLVEYSDFSCPHCRDLAPSIGTLIDQYVRPGKLRIIYKTVTFVGGAYSAAAARAAFCAAQQGKGWEMQDQIWAIFTANGPGAYTDQNLAAHAQTIGLDAGKFSACYGSAEATTAIQSVADEVQARGVDATPTLFVDSQKLDYTGPDSIIQAIQSRLAAKSTQGPATAAPTP